MTSKASQDEPSQDATTPPGGDAARRGRATRRLLFAGVCGACVLGVGLGLWARPGEAERRLSLTAAHAAPGQPKPTLQIVLDDKAAPQAPTARPAAVLAADHPVASSFAPSPPAAAPEPIAPTAPPTGLMKAHAVTVPAAVPAPQPDLIAQAAAAQRRQAATEAAQAKEDAVVAHRKAVAQQQAAAKAEAAQKLAAEKAAKAQALAKAEKAAKAAQLAKAEKAHAAEAARQAALEARKTKLAQTKLAQAKLAQAKLTQARLAEAKAAAAHKAEAIRLAKAEAAEQAAADARRRRITDLAHKFAQAMERKRAEAAEARAQAQREVKLAEAKAAKALRARAEQARIEKATLQRRQDAAARAAQKRTIRGEGPLRLASNHCASGDAAAALVCADPGLSSADRQMNRLYQQAEAAGVPAWRLRQQQQRWLQARAAAAREAPWAVHDVYVARIAELQDQARNAGSGGY